MCCYFPVVVIIINSGLLVSILDYRKIHHFCVILVCAFASLLRLRSKLHENGARTNYTWSSNFWKRSNSRSSVHGGQTMMPVLERSVQPGACHVPLWKPLQKNTAVLHRQMTPLIITLLYLSKVAWYVVRNARKLTNDIKLMAVAKIGPCVDWLKKKLCFSKGRHRYASF